MDLSIIEAIHPVTIINPENTVSGRSSFDHNIYVPFEPDFLIVKSINYSSEERDLVIGVNQFVGVFSNIVNEIASIGSFNIYVTSHNAGVDNTSIVSNNSPLMFRLNKQIQGSYNFSFRNASGSNITLYGDMFIHLEFVKVKVDKPQKFY